MSKDWLTYKSVVQQLYVDEGRTVHQVRIILRSKYGFNASVRAYRMKFVEWGLRKYKSRKSPSSQQNASRTSRELVPEEPSALSPSTSTTSQPIDNKQNPEAEQSPSEFYPVDVLLNLINAGTYSSISVLETLLFHWLPSTEWSEALLSYFHDPDFNKWVARYPGPGTPAVFKLIEDCVPEAEQFALTKSLLEADLSCMVNPNHFYTPWQGSWYQVCTAEEWVEAKELLYEDGILSNKAGVFLDCAPVVIAEQLLGKLSARLEQYTDQLDADAKRACSEQYQEILSHFRHSKVDVSPYFYKFLLQVDFDEASNDSHDCKLWAEYRQRYIRLKALTPESPQESASSPHILDTRTKQTLENFDQGSLSSTSSPPHIDGLHSFTQSPTAFTSSINTRKSAEILIKKWKLLTGFEEYAHSVIARDGSHILVFEPMKPSSENLFDVTVEIIEKIDLIAFAKSLLVAFTTALAKCPSPSWLLQWWCVVYLSPTWEKFQAMLDNQQVAEHLQRCMSLAAAKIFTDAAIILVGEELLSNLKNGMVAARWRHIAASSVAEFTQYSHLQQRYMSILGEFQKREIKVDRSWISYLLNVM